MEGKERYELQEVENELDLNDTDIAIVDNEKGGIISYNNACKLLNQQDAKIKELDRLRNKLHSQPKEIVEKIMSKMDNVVDTLINCGNGKEDAIAWFCDILQEILKEYEEEINKENK